MSFDLVQSFKGGQFFILDEAKGMECPFEVFGLEFNLDALECHEDSFNIVGQGMRELTGGDHIVSLHFYLSKSRSGQYELEEFWPLGEAFFYFLYKLSL